MDSANQQITFVYTADLAASARFYGEQLGLPLVIDQGSCRIYRVNASRVYRHLHERERADAGGNPGEAPTHPHLGGDGCARAL